MVLKRFEVEMSHFSILISMVFQFLIDVMNGCGHFASNNIQQVNRHWSNIVVVIVFSLKTFLEAKDIQQVRSLLHNSPQVNFVEPPYHIARHSRLTIEEKLQHIQQYIQNLEYNYTGMQFFNINANRPLHTLMDTARYM